MSATETTGQDGISCKLLTWSAEIIAPHIVNICNAYINNAHFPLGQSGTTVALTFFRR